MLRLFRQSHRILRRVKVACAWNNISTYKLHKGKLSIMVTKSTNCITDGSINIIVIQIATEVTEMGTDKSRKYAYNMVKNVH